MEKLTIDESLSAKLVAPLELCDPSGQTVGFFVPTCEATDAEYERVDSKFDAERIEQARRETGGKTTAEVLRSLESPE